MRELLIRGMFGLGDNILQRPFVRAAIARYDAIYLQTPWPELYCDMAVQFCRPATGLRTQAKNIARQCSFVPPPRTCSHAVSISYHALTGSFQSAMEATLPLGDVAYSFDLPKYGLPQIALEKPLAVVRPVTMRREWRNTARNPLPEYIKLIAERLMATHFVLVVADLADGEEWLIGNCPPHHLALLHGELSVTDLMAVVEAADICVGGIGWLTVAAIAYRRPVFTVLGGMGKLNSIERITDPRMDLRTAGFAVPEKFCRCTDMMHDCDKRIPNLQRVFLDWFDTMQRTQNNAIAA